MASGADRALLAVWPWRGSHRRTTSQIQSSDSEITRDFHTLRRVLSRTWINYFLIVSPVGIVLHYAQVSPVAVFVVNLLAVVPLVELVRYVTLELEKHRLGPLSDLLKVLSSVWYELIVSVIALLKNEIVVVQTAVIGSLLSNVLLTLGMGFLVGGMGRKGKFQSFNVKMGDTALQLLAFNFGSISIPTVAGHALEGHGEREVLATSRAGAVISLVIYISYFTFRAFSHKYLYKLEAKKKERALRNRKPLITLLVKTVAVSTAHDFESSGHALSSILGEGIIAEPVNEENGSAHQPQLTASEPSDRRRSRQSGASEQGSRNYHSSDREQIAPEGCTNEDAIDEGSVSAIDKRVAWVILIISVVVCTLCTSGVVDSISAVGKELKVSRVFLGLILLSLCGNVVELVITVWVTSHGDLDLGLDTVAGKGLQSILLLLPLMVILGWIFGRDAMTFKVDLFAYGTLFVALFLWGTIFYGAVDKNRTSGAMPLRLSNLGYEIDYGIAFWLEGMVLVGAYLIISLFAFFYPVDGPSANNAA